jgi:multiple sugar transport system ATP-binding protein
VNLAIEPGELVVFVGPSGCGKSTLLRLIAGLEEPSSGSIHISGNDVTRVHPSQRGVAMVFQSYALYPHMTVAENMGFGLKIQRSPREEIDARVRRAAEILQLETLLDRKPRALSGGQRQRVAIGRAIVREPDVFLFDEPLSNLDAALRGQMRVEIARLHARLGATMIYVTHDQVEAMTLASRIVVLNGGKIEQVGAPLELYHRPANLFVAGFLGSPRMNLLPARVARVLGDSVELDVAGDVLRVARASAGEGDDRESGSVAAGDAVIVGIRPECLSRGRSAPGEATRMALSTGEGGARDVLTLSGEVTLLERLGSEALAHVRLRGDGNVTVVAKLAGDAPLAAGEQVALTAPAAACHIFDSAGNAIREHGP